MKSAVALYLRSGCRRPGRYEEAPSRPDRGLGSQGIGEENNEVDAPLHDLRADLLVTAERTAVIALYRETGGFGDHSRGSSCAAQEMSL